MGRKERLGELLVRAGLIDELQLRRALGEQHQWGGRLGEALLKLGFVSEEDLVHCLARQLGLPAVRLAGKTIDPGVLELIPPELAQKYRCLPLFSKREAGFDVLYLAMDDPTDLPSIDDLSFRTGRRIRPVLAGPRELAEALARFTEPPAQAAESPAGEFAEIPLEPGDTAPVLKGLADDPLQRAGKDGRPASKPREVSTRAILRAVTDLLIEKGLIDREELLDRIRERLRA